MLRHHRLCRLVKCSSVALAALSVVFFLLNVASATGAETAGAVADRILETAGFDGGLVVHLGCGDGKRTVALGVDDGCLVLGLTRDAVQVEAARRRIVGAGLGGKVAVHPWSGGRLPLVDNVARLIVVEEPTAASRDELLRALCPGGAVLQRRGETWERIVKPWPDEIDEWTHYLRDASGNAVARDTRVGPPRHMQWLCGPRWMRNHHMLASISAIVSEGGRIFYILDEGPPANLNVPGKWSVVARDAFSGVLLWKRPIESWAHWRHKFRAGPVQLARLLVAGPGRVYLPLGLGAPLTALDAASGEAIRTYDQTQGVEEALLDGDTLLVVAASPTTAQEAAGPGKPKPSAKRKVDRRGDPKTPYMRTLMAIEAESGRRLWKWSSDEGNPEPMGLATDGRRVCFQFGKGVVCLDRETGSELWRTPEARQASKSPRLMSDSTVVVEDDVVLWTDSETVWALAAEDGRELWSCKTNPSLTASKGQIIDTRAGFRSSADLFVIDGLVWVGAQFAEGRDLKTGEVRKTNVSAASIQTAGHHHRCYREKATSRYILIGQRGTEFLDLRGDNHSRNNWIRGVCQTTLCSEHPVGRGATPEQDAQTPKRPFVQNATDARTFLAPDRSDGFSMAGTISDVMVGNGDSVFLRHLRFNRELNPQETKARHLFSTSRLVDETENHRIHWVLGTGDFSRIGVAYSWQVNMLGARNRYQYKPDVPFGLLLAFSDQTAWGVRRPEGYKGYELVAWHNTPFAAGERRGPDIRKMRPGEGVETGEVWTKILDMRPRSLAHASEMLVLGGGPYKVTEQDPFAAEEGRLGGLIQFVRGADGELIAEHQLDSPVVWNGLAVAGDRLYAATMDGQVVCLAQ